MNIHVGKGKKALKLEDGKSYRAASGAIYRVEANDNDSWPFKTADEDLSVSRFWKEDGSAYNKDVWYIHAAPGDDLVSELTLTIQAGKFYKTRDGRKVGPITEAQGRDDPWPWKTEDSKLYYKNDGHSCPGYAHAHERKDDLVAEWVDEAPKTEFKVGDRVVYTTKEPAHGAEWTDGVMTIDAIFGDNVDLHYGEPGYFQTANLADIALAPPTTTTHAIVCLIRNGQPIPATKPHVHASRAAARKEADRLAGVSPGDEFGVYELVATKKVEKAYELEWKNLAARGEKIAAIKSLRTLAGIGLKGAKDIVDRWTHDNANGWAA